MRRAGHASRRRDRRTPGRTNAQPKTRQPNRRRKPSAWLSAESPASHKVPTQITLTHFHQPGCQRTTPARRRPCSTFPTGGTPMITGPSTLSTGTVQQNFKFGSDSDSIARHAVLPRTVAAVFRPGGRVGRISASRYPGYLRGCIGFAGCSWICSWIDLPVRRRFNFRRRNRPQMFG